MKTDRSMAKSRLRLGSRQSRRIWAALGILALAPQVDAATVQTNIPYVSPGASTSAQFLDLYTPNSGINPNAPTVILLHAGGYTTGNKTEVASIATELANRGFNVVASNYTLATPNAPSFPQSTTDTLNVVRWCRTTGNQLGLSSTVVLGGFSAGATIAATACYASPSGTYTNQPPPPNRGYLVDAAVLFYGRYDIRNDAVTIGVPSYLVQYTGVAQPPQTQLDLYGLASAITYVDDCAPPTALYHAQGDPVVSAQNTARLDFRLRQLGIPVWTNILPGGTHNYTLLGSAADTAQTLTQAISTLLSVSTPSCPRNTQTPAGACCDPSGGCVSTTQSFCQWSWIAQGLCVPNTCPILGACCAVPGQCTVAPQPTCTGTWTSLATCSPVTCPTPDVSGACCFGASCGMADADTCTGPNRRFLGPNATCNAPDNPFAPCCRADFSQDGINSIDDLFLFFNAWFSSSPSACLSGATSPVIDDLFRYISAYFAGC